VTIKGQMDAGLTRPPDQVLTGVAEFLRISAGPPEAVKVEFLYQGPSERVYITAEGREIEFGEPDWLSLYQSYEQ
jgi:hypothetical protein